jgi:hypothetical protein
MGNIALQSVSVLRTTTGRRAKCVVFLKTAPAAQCPQPAESDRTESGGCAVRLGKPLPNAVHFTANWQKLKRQLKELDSPLAIAGARNAAENSWGRPVFWPSPGACADDLGGPRVPSGPNSGPAALGDPAGPTDSVYPHRSVDSTIQAGLAGSGEPSDSDEPVGLAPRSPCHRADGTASRSRRSRSRDAFREEALRALDYRCRRASFFPRSAAPGKVCCAAHRGGLLKA